MGQNAWGWQTSNVGILYKTVTAVMVMVAATLGSEHCHHQDDYQ